MRDGLLTLRVEGLWAEFGLAAAIVGAATCLGLFLRLVSPDILPGALLFPAILLPSLIGGWRSGAAAGLLSLAARAFVLRPAVDPLFGASGVIFANIVIFVLAAAGVIAMGGYVRFLLERVRRGRDALSEHSLHYATLFDMIPEGFAVCEGIRDAGGALVDYTVVEMNPALQRLLGVGREAIGSRLSEAPGNWTRWLKLCDQVLTTGEQLNFERLNRENGRWHEVHLSRLTPTRLAQFFFDITERKANETRQAQLFDELNHRVKNNLAMVASLLQLQARGAGNEVRGELIKAAARVQSIAEVHGALSRDGFAENVDFGAYLQDLCAGLRDSLAIRDEIALDVEAEPASLPVDAALPLGMVVNELVTNAVKYAYPGGEGGSIGVGFRNDGGLMLLTVRDQGAGLPAEAGRRDGGLGMRLVRSLVAQVGGELIIGAGEGSGARFEIRFRNNAASVVTP